MSKHIPRRPVEGGSSPEHQPQQPAEQSFQLPAGQPEYPPHPPAMPEDGAGTDDTFAAPEAPAHAPTPPTHPPETDESFLNHWTSELEDRPIGDEAHSAPMNAPEAPTDAPTVGATDGEAAPATPADPEQSKDTRWYRGTKKGKAFLIGTVAAAAIGFGGNVVADQIVEPDGIIATDSRETGEKAIAFQENVANNLEYAAEFGLAIGGLVFATRGLRKGGRVTKRAYRKVIPAKKKDGEGESTDAES